MITPNVHRMFIRRMYSFRKINPTKPFVEKKKLWVDQLCEVSIAVGGPILIGYLFIKSLPYIADFTFSNFDKVHVLKQTRKQKEKDRALDTESESELAKIKSELEKKILISQSKIQREFDEKIRLINEKLQHLNNK